MTLELLLKKVKRKILKIAFSKPDFLEINKRNKVKECYICGEKFELFYKYRLNKENDRASNYFQIIGSDTENYGCYYCNCNDRERHLYMYFDKISLWEKFNNAKIIHFAPESIMSQKIEQQKPLIYVKCDLFPKDDWEKIDITKINYQDDYFDILICNHVIEHIPDYLQAFKEISRVLNKNGFAILQTPFSELLYNNFEDPNINTDDLKLTFYGQEDHARIVSKRQFIEELSQFFTLNIIKNSSLFTDEECIKYGVNNKEDLIMVFNNKEGLNNFISTK